jgi:hypothetical protein
VGEGADDDFDNALSGIAAVEDTALVGRRPTLSVDELLGSLLDS